MTSLGARFLRILSAATALTLPLGVAPPTAAQELSGGVGLFLGASFGERTNLNWGVETFGTAAFPPDECDSRRRVGVGPLLRYSMQGLGAPTFTVAARGAADLVVRGGPAVDVEAGLSLGWREKGLLLSPHTGALFEMVLAHIYLRQDWAISEHSIGLGTRLLPSLGIPGGCLVGRPRRDGTGAVITPQRAARSSTLGEWGRRAAEELDAVGAFLELALELAAHGAPVELIERALLSAEQEVSHTARCLSEARRLGEALPALTPPSVTRPLRTGKLAELAVESWLDGVLGEGLAARSLDVSATFLDDTGAATARSISAEEQQHERLGLEITRWCLATGGAEVRDALAASRGARLHAAGTGEWARDSMLEAQAEFHAQASGRALEGLLS